MSERSVFAVRLVEALGSVIEVEPGGIRFGPGVPPPVQRRIAAQVGRPKGRCRPFAKARSGWDLDSTNLAKSIERPDLAEKE